MFVDGVCVRVITYVGNGEICSNHAFKRVYTKSTCLLWYDGSNGCDGGIDCGPYPVSSIYSHDICLKLRRHTSCTHLFLVNLHSTLSPAIASFSNDVWMCWKIPLTARVCVCFVNGFDNILSRIFFPWTHFELVSHQQICFRHTIYDPMNIRRLVV